MFDQLGPALRRLRAARHRSQQEVAAAADLARTTLSRFETGEMVPSLPTLARILTALDIPLTRLAEELSPAPGATQNAPAPSHEETGPEFEDQEAVAPEAQVVADLLLGGAKDLTPEAREVFTDLIDDVYHLSRLMQRPPGGRKGGGGKR